MSTICADTDLPSPRRKSTKSDTLSLHSSVSCMCAAKCGHDDDVTTDLLDVFLPLRRARFGSRYSTLMTAMGLKMPGASRTDGK